jgi:hypothetical protein
LSVEVSMTSAAGNSFASRATRGCGFDCVGTGRTTGVGTGRTTGVEAGRIRGVEA